MAEDNKAQNQAQANTDAQRRAAAASQQQGNTGVAGQQGSQQGQQRSAQDAQQARRQTFDQEKRAVAERSQQSGNEGSQPTPTQQENDEIRAGLRHIDDKEDDRSGPDPKFAVRRIDAEEARGKYETR